MYVVEFQKRSLPHAHILLIMHPDDAPCTTDNIDRVVSAEFPDPATRPEVPHRLLIAVSVSLPAHALPLHCYGRARRRSRP